MAYTPSLKDIQDISASDDRYVPSLEDLPKEDESSYGRTPKKTAQDFIENFRLENSNQYMPDIEGSLATKPQRVAAVETAAMAIPSFRASKYIKESAPWIKKALTNYGGSIAQNSAIGAGANLLEGDSPERGGLIGGATTAAIHPIASAVSSRNPFTRMAALGGIAGGGAYLADKAGYGSTTTDLLAAGLGASLGLKGRGSRDAAILEHLKDVKLEDAAPRLEAAKRLNLRLTPAEATGSAYLGGKQGTLGKTYDGSLLLEKKSKERIESERGAIDNLISTIGTKDKLKPEREALYKSAYESSVEPDVLQKLKSSSIINEGFEEVGRDPVYKDKLKGIPESNFMYLNQVKVVLNDLERKALKKGENDKARLIREKTKEMTSLMDELNPSYKKARELAQRGIISNKLIKKIKEREVKGTNFYNSFLRNKNNYEELRSSLSNVPEAQRQLDDMRLVFEHLINPETARAASKLAKTSMSEARSSLKDAFNLIHKLKGKKYDKAAINLISDPKWADELERVKFLNSNNEKTQAISNLLSRAASTPFR